MIYDEQSSDSTPVKIGGALVDAIVFVGMIVFVTFLMVLLYKYRCMKVTLYWLRIMKRAHLV